MDFHNGLYISARIMNVGYAVDDEKKVCQRPGSVKVNKLNPQEILPLFFIEKISFVHIDL